MANNSSVGIRGLSHQYENGRRKLNLINVWTEKIGVETIDSFILGRETELYFFSETGNGAVSNCVKGGRKKCVTRRGTGLEAVL